MSGVAPPGAVVVRPVRDGDGPAISALLDGLDPESRFRRWFTGGVDLRAAEEWATHPERSSAVGLLAFVDGEVVGHAVLVPDPAGGGEVAFEVAAAWRRHGIAGRLLAELRTAADGLGLHEVHATVLGENADMLAVMRESGPHRETRDGSITTVAVPVPR